MPVVSRSQLVAYALAALVVVVLGVRFMQGQARGSAVSAAGGAVVTSPECDPPTD